MGPLSGLKVLEVASLGPGPFCAMVLADHGANVLRVERPGGSDRTMSRDRDTVIVDLKTTEGVDTMLGLVDRADVLIEGFRPGVAERLGFGPEPCLGRNPGLVYARMTGWGQQGPLADRAGHDINYIAMSGVLGAVGRAGQAPTPPLNLVGDFGGGGLLLAFGILAALWERNTTGAGQVIDAAMVDGSAVLATMVFEMLNAGTWADAQASNLLDTGCPFYDTYRTADGGWMAVGALEPQFFAELVDVTGIDVQLDAQFDRSSWPRLRTELARVFASRSRDEWEAAFEGRDACVAPVLSLAEAVRHPANSAREVFVDRGHGHVPGPAPRFSRTPSRPVGTDRDAWGL